jgi:hypothetical protein
MQGKICDGKWEEPPFAAGLDVSRIEYEARLTNNGDRQLFLQED